MVRLLLSNRDNGVYEYYFEPVVKENTEDVLRKFLRKHGFVRRFRVNPLDKLEKARIISGEYGGNGEEILSAIKRECMNKCSVEETNLFLTVVKEAVDVINKAIEKSIECYRECLEEVVKK